MRAAAAALASSLFFFSSSFVAAISSLCFFSSLIVRIKTKEVEAQTTLPRQMDYLEMQKGGGGVNSQQPTADTYSSLALSSETLLRLAPLRGLQLTNSTSKMSVALHHMIEKITFNLVTSKKEI